MRRRFRREDKESKEEKRKHSGAMLSFSDAALRCRSKKAARISSL